MNLYPQSDSVWPLRRELRARGSEHADTASDGIMLAALYANEGDVTRAADWLLESRIEADPLAKTRKEQT